MSSVTFSPGAVIGRTYRVVRPLAQGGMGAVYVCEDPTGRRCAVKVMHARLIDDPKNRARFAQEAAVSEHIGTEHVVDVFGRGIDEATGMPFIAMELLEGETLQARIWRGGHPNVLPREESLAVLDQLATVLEAAHARGLVHRDLKPENIFLTPRPHQGAPFTLKLLDFGVARFVDPSRPVHNATAAIGTPLWMAPEQHTGAEISPAADVWAVGLIAFQLLPGRFYWLAANQKELNIPQLLQELLFDPLPPAVHRAAALGCTQHIPVAFDAWFTRCVARDPAARFPTAVPMRAALAASLAGPLSTPTPARPPPPASPQELPTQVLAEAPTRVVLPTAFEAPTVARPSVRAAGSRTAIVRARPLTVAIGALLGLVLVGAALAVLRPWASDDPPRPPGLFPPTRSHGATAPSISPTPLPLPLPRPAAPPSVFLEGQRRTWQGSLAGQTIEGAGFELTLERVGHRLHGNVKWMFSDGGEHNERAQGSWDVEKSEISLRLDGESGRRIHAYLLPNGDLSGELLPGGGARPTPLHATLKTPLVGAPTP
ncbi:MAG: serine/threonine-protein kinase [Polyangiales bacterium]